jgi:hypothetical protein
MLGVVPAQRDFSCHSHLLAHEVKDVHITQYMAYTRTGVGADNWP